MLLYVQNLSSFSMRFETGRRKRGCPFERRLFRDRDGVDFGGSLLSKIEKPRPLNSVPAPNRSTACLRALNARAKFGT